VKHVNFERWGDSEAALALQHGVNALTKNGILTPGTQVRPFMRTPLGEVPFQYKKFVVSGLDRCLLPALGRMLTGELAIIGGLLAMIALGGLKEVIARLASGRDLPTFDEFWEYGVGNCDALPLIGELFKDVAHGFNSGGMTGGVTGANGVSALLAGKRHHMTNSEVP
jgi:hypothetical protein